MPACNGGVYFSNQIMPHTQELCGERVRDAFFCCASTASAGSISGDRRRHNGLGTVDALLRLSLARRQASGDTELRVRGPVPVAFIERGGAALVSMSES
jgi:hypothetical protein